MSLIRVANRMPYAVGGVPANATRDVSPEVIAAHPWAFVVHGAVAARYPDKREKPAKVKDAAKVAEKAVKDPEKRGPGRPPKVRPEAEKHASEQAPSDAAPAQAPAPSEPPAPPASEGSDAP